MSFDAFNNPANVVVNGNLIVQKGAAPSSAVSLDGGLITSDGAGNLTATSFVGGVTLTGTINHVNTITDTNGTSWAAVTPGTVTRIANPTQVAIQVPGGVTKLTVNAAGTFAQGLVNAPAFQDVYNVMYHGATGNGTTDDTTAIQNTINAVSTNGGTVYFPPGTYLISTPLTISAAGTTLAGAGSGATTILPSQSFSGAQFISITGRYAGVRDMQVGYASGAYSSNPAANGIQVTGAQNATFTNLLMNYINGWCIQTTTDVSNQACDGCVIQNVTSYGAKQGIHCQGTSAHDVEACVIHSVIMSAVQAGDGLFLENAQDMYVSSSEFYLTAGAGHAIHIKGRCGAIHIVNSVSGGNFSSTTGNAVQIDSNGDGTPNEMQIGNCIFESSVNGINITACTNTSIHDCSIFENTGSGMVISGASTDHLKISRCSFNQNGFTAGTGDYDLSSSASGHILIQGCSFITSIGSGAVQVTNSINVTSGHVQCLGNEFAASTSNVFNNKPEVIRSNMGYNPIGVLGPPSVPTSTTPLTNPYAVDATVFVTGGTVTVIAVGGTSTGLTSGAFRVPALQTITLTYSVAPTWVWIGE